MADISILSRLINGVQRNVNLSQNTLVVESLKVDGTELTKALLDALLEIRDDLASTANGEGASLIGIEDASDHYTGSTVEAALSEVGTSLSDLSSDISDLNDETVSLRTLSGTDASSNNLGTFTGETISDSATIKSALQELETDLELKADKEYVDSIAQGLEPKGSVDYATSGPVDLEDAPATIDGVTVAEGDRVLVKDQADPAENGIYTVIDDGGLKFERAVDFDGEPDHEVKGGDWVYSENGDVNGGTSWVVLGQGSKDVGTDAINWTKINKVTPNQAGDAIEISNGLISVLVDDETIEIASNELSVKDDGIDGSKILLDNNQMMRAKNFADDGQVEILKVNASDRIEFASLPQSGATPSSSDDLTNKAYVDGVIGSFDSSSLKESFDLGENLASITGLRAFRMMRASDSGFQAGHVIRADNDAENVDNFHIIGLVIVDEENVDDSMLLVKSGKMTVASHGLTIGQPFWLGTDGSLTSTAPSTTNIAVVKCGMVRDANTLEIQIQIMGVN